MDKSVVGALIAAGFTLNAISAAAATAAEEGSVHVGVSVGQALIEDEEEIDDGVNLEIDGDDTGFKIFADYMFTPNFGVEAGYVDFGAQEDDFSLMNVPDEFGTVDIAGDLEIEASGYTVAAVGVLPLGPVDVFAKVGVIFWDADIEIDAVFEGGEGSGTISESDGVNGEDLMYGVGASMSFGEWALRLEYENYDIDEVDSAALWSLGVTYGFTP